MNKYFIRFGCEGYYDTDIVNELTYTAKDLFFYQKSIQKNCVSSSNYFSHIHDNITNQHVEKSIYNLIILYISYYAGILPEMNSVDRTTYCDQYILMVDFIINKFMSNDYDEYHRRMIQFEDKYSHGLIPVKQLFDFYGQHYRCVTNEPSIDCSQLSPTLSLLSPLGKCHTFLSNDSNQIPIKSINILINNFYKRRNANWFVSTLFTE